MSTFKNIDEAREFFTGDKFAMANGITIDELWEDGCLCSMELRADHRNAVGGVMGGVIFTLADFAFGVAANNGGGRTVSLSSSIAFIGAAKGERLIAEAKCVKNGKSTCCYTVSVTDELGTKVAEITTTGFNKA